MQEYQSPRSPSAIEYGLISAKVLVVVIVAASTIGSAIKSAWVNAHYARATTIKDAQIQADIADLVRTQMHLSSETPIAVSTVVGKYNHLSEVDARWMVNGDSSGISFEPEQLNDLLRPIEAPKYAEKDAETFSRLSYDRNGLAFDLQWNDPVRTPLKKGPLSEGEMAR